MFSLAWEAITNFNLADTWSQIVSAFSNLNFITWFSYYRLDWNGISALVADSSSGFSASSFGQYCAQYAATMTNWAYTIAALTAIVVLLLKKNKKWYWYCFFAIVALMSVTSVGMHTADYGEFAPGKITTKLLASYVDMTFTELMAWSGVLCFIFEFYGDNEKLRDRFAKVVSGWSAFVLLMLTFEVFIQKNRPLWIGGRDAMGLPFDMGGDHGGLSLAELGCFITCLPLLYILITKFKTIPRGERGLVILLIGTFATAFVITSLWGDNEINFIAEGNFHGHSFWHLLTAIGTTDALIWVDHRTQSEQKKKEIDIAVKTAVAEALRKERAEKEAEAQTVTA